MEKTRKRSNKKRVYNENQQLKRENARIRKQLQQLGEDVDLNKEGLIEEDFDKKAQEDIPPKQKEQCPKCGKTLKGVEFGNFKYMFCSECNYRQRTK